jgi:hypothetical protein
MEQLENAYTDGTVQLDTSILMSKAENKYAELIETRIHRQQQEEGRRLSLSSRPNRVLKAFYTKFQNGDEGKHLARKEVAQVVILSSGPVSHPGRGTAVQDDCGKDYHWCVGNNAHKPKWVRHEPSSAVDLTIRRKATLPSLPPNRKKEKCDQRRQSVKWSSAMRATLVHRG